ncbi:MAG: MarR family winged helix-turn-helix transcriptional regulator, partial [Sulfitobacter sp.]|nr:MarR family winged helix-turn-helix transcriptional regulator [Sulfitobacter sp.]
VERIPVPGDRRAMVLRLTAAGQAEFEKQAMSHEDWIDEMLHGVSAYEARTMAARLQAFADAADAQTKQKEDAHAQ